MPNPAKARGDPWPVVTHRVRDSLTSELQCGSSITDATEGALLCDSAVKDLSRLLQGILVEIQSVKCQLDDTLSPLAARGRKLVEDARCQFKLQEQQDKAPNRNHEEHSFLPKENTPTTESTVSIKNEPTAVLIKNEAASSSSVECDRSDSEEVVQNGKKESQASQKRITEKMDEEVEHNIHKSHDMFGEMVNQDVTDDYDVRRFYKEQGLAQAIARKEWFGSMTLFIIAVNAVYIAFDAEFNNSRTLYASEPVFIISDNAFCCYFCLEWLIRFSAFAKKINATRDTWMVFDTTLAVLVVLETWILPLAFESIIEMVPLQVLKLPRLLRLVRMGRLVRSFPELVAMMKGILVASRAVGSAFMLLFGLVYIFSIVIFISLDKTAEPDLEDRYGNLAVVMWTLLVDGTFMDNLRLAFEPLAEHEEWLALVALGVFVLLSATTVLNMLIGVLCEVVTAVAAAEKEETAIRYVQRTLLVMLRILDEDQSGNISKEELSHIFDNDVAMEVLSDLKVDVEYLVDSLDMHFASNNDEVSIQKVMDLILMLRGDRSPTVKDMIHSQSFNSWKISLALESQKEKLMEMTKSEKKIEEKLKKMETSMGFAQLFNSTSQ